MWQWLFSAPKCLGPQLGKRHDWGVGIIWRLLHAHVWWLVRVENYAQPGLLTGITLHVGWDSHIVAAGYRERTFQEGMWRTIE